MDAKMIIGINYSETIPSCMIPDGDYPPLDVVLYTGIVGENEEFQPYTLGISSLADDAELETGITAYTREELSNLNIDFTVDGISGEEQVSQWLGET